MQEEKRNHNYPECKRTCQMCVRVAESENEEKTVCPWLPCYYRLEADGSAKKNSAENRNKE